MEAWRPLFSPRCNIEVDKGDTEAMSHNEVMGSDSRAERKREKRRLVNAPFFPAAFLMNRKRALRAATESYCTMLYEIAYCQLDDRAEPDERRKGDTEAMSQNDVMGLDSRAQRKREKPRLVNAPLVPAAVLMNRKRALRAATTSYCAMLYKSAFWELGERTARAERRAQIIAGFKRDAARLHGRKPHHLPNFPIIGGEPAIRINIRNPVSAVTHELFFRLHTTYGTLFHMVRELFGQPTRKTSVSMRLWHDADAEHIIECRTDCRLHKELHDKTLCAVFYSTQPESTSSTDSSMEFEEVD